MMELTTSEMQTFKYMYKTTIHLHIIKESFQCLYVSCLIYEPVQANPDISEHLQLVNTFAWSPERSLISGFTVIPVYIYIV